jgi:hypothetical protein
MMSLFTCWACWRSWNIAYASEGVLRWRTRSRIFTILHRLLNGFQKGKAVTIGVGFDCNDGILLCSDTQITREGFHKFYEHKLFPHQGSGWSVAFTYAGDPHTMKSFDDSFSDAMYSITAPITLAIIEQQIKDTLSTIDSGDQLFLLCGIVASGAKRLLKVEGLKPGRVSIDFVGVGDVSVLRYLFSMLSRGVISYSVQRAELLSAYLVLQAKRWVDGCGGETEVIIIRQDGRIEPSPRIQQGVEMIFGILEEYLSRVAVGFFDERITEPELDERLATLSNRMKGYRESLMTPKGQSG